MSIKGRTRMAVLFCGLLLWAGPVAAAAAADAADALRLVWAADRGQGFDLFTAVQEKNGWGPSTRLVDGPEADITPACTVDQGGHLWLVWIVRDREGRSQLRYRIDALGRKPREGRIVTGFDDNYAPVVLIDREGTGWVAWASYTGSSDDVFASRFDGAGWSAPLRVHAANDQPDVKPFLSLSGDGRVQVTWLGLREGGYQRFQVQWNGTGFLGERVVADKTWEQGMHKHLRRKAPPLPRETRAQGMVTAFLPGNREIQAVPDWVFPLTFSEGR